MSDIIRMSGMNSGLDTEAIIKALTANSKLKITKQERNILKYKAQQDAYRDVISKLTNLKSSYFDILKKDSYLSGQTMWNRFAAKTVVDGAEKNIAGFTATTSINSLAGDYKIKVNKTSTQAKIQGGSLSDGAKLDPSALSEGESYGISVTVGDETKNITFTGGATAEETLENINKELTKAFGESNTSASTASSKGLVYVNDSGKFVSRASKGISISGIGNMKNSGSISLADIATGNNSLSFQVGDEVVNVSFQTLAKDYFSDIFGDDGKIKNDADKSKVALYNQVKDDYVESKKYEEYEAWAATATDEEKEAVRKQAFTEAQAEHYKNELDKYLGKQYDEYRKTGSDDFNTWKANNFVEGDENNELWKGFSDIYYDVELTPEQEAAREADLNTFLTEKYNVYTSEGGTDDFDTWKAASFKDKDPSNPLYGEFKAIDDEKYPTRTGRELDEDLWTGVSYKEYEAFKSQLGTVKEENLTITAETVVGHYNETSLNNSVGNLETKSGVKFDVEINGTDVTITAKDKDGNPRSFSVTAGAESANSFGASSATTSISQISNSTTLADLGATADENGKYNFEINGKSFSFDKTTTVKDMLKNINASSAGVKIAYSSLDNAFSITANEFGTGSKIEITGDAQGLLGGLGLTSPSAYTAGTNLEVEINGKLIESDGNSVEVDGTTFTFNAASEGAEFTTSIEKDNSAIADTIKKFVEDYNKVIKEVYEMLDEEPEKKYYFLADADKEELNLSEKQEEQWEEKAKKGLLYNDSTISSIMSKLRTSLMGVIEDADGKSFSLASLGIKTSTDWKEHGKLTIDEDKLNAAISEHSDDIAKLFSDSENGIMNKFAEALEGAIGTTGDKGTLINKAGLASGSTAKENQIYEMIKRTNEKITTLKKRYESEENRLWKKYSAMEQMMSTLNSQSASISSYFQ